MIQIKDRNGKLIQERDNADLRHADLTYADLRNAYLYDADLSGACLNWNSHQLISEILIRAAGDDINKIAVAGLIRTNTDWCWEHFESLEHPAREWAIAELAKWVKDGDGAPGFIKEAAAALLEV